MKKYKEQIITIDDCKIIRGILDVITQRGGFKGTELSTIGSIYDKLTKVIEIHNNAEKQIDGGEESNGWFSKTNNQRNR